MSGIIRGNDVGKKILYCVLCIGLVFGVGFASGVWAIQGRYKPAFDQYENRLATLTNINADLQNKNSQLTELNKSLTKRLDDINGRLRQAEDIIRGLDVQTSTDGDTIQRLIDNLHKLEKVISILFDSKQG